MATINSRIIKAHKTKAKHVIKLLESLAKRERLHFKLVDDLTERRATRISFWLWKDPQEVDDSELVDTDQTQYPNRPEDLEVLFEEGVSLEEMPF